MTATLFEDIANAPVSEPDADMFAGGSIEDEAPQRTSEGRTRGRGSRTRERECENCGNTFVGGHKLCPDCKGTQPRATRTTTAAPRGSVKLEEELLECLIEVASDISPVMPTVAGVLVARGEQATHGLVALAKGKPRTTAVLQKIAKGGQSAGLVSFAVMLGIAAMVDLGRIGTDSVILDNVGYAEILRDEKGKAKRDEKGLLVKERHTLREIHDMMTGEDSSAPQMPDVPMWNAYGGPTVQPDTGTGKATIPGMNWTP